MIPLKGSKDKKQWIVIREVILFGVNVYLFIQTILKIQSESSTLYYVLILMSLGMLMLYQIDEVIGWILNKKKEHGDNKTDIHTEK